MEKIKNAIRWVAYDGLLHIETFALIVLVLTPILGFLKASIVAAVLAIGREVVQFLRGKNNKEQVHHDMICNGIGWVVASIVVLCWQM